MKSTLIIFLYITGISFLGFSQKKNDFSFEFHLGGSHFSADSLNKFINDSITFYTTFGYEHLVFSDSTTELEFKSAFQPELRVMYQPFDFLSFGLSADVFFKKQYRNALIFWAEQPGDPYSSEYRRSEQTIKVSSLKFGLPIALHINKLTSWHESKSKFVQNSSLKFTVAPSIAYSKLSVFFNDSVYDGYNSFSFPLYQYWNYSSTDFSLKAEVGYGYRFQKVVFFSELGLKIGYQYLCAKQLRRDEYGKFSVVDLNSSENRLRLNFSGIYYGLYFMIGK